MGSESNDVDRRGRERKTRAKERGSGRVDERVGEECKRARSMCASVCEDAGTDESDARRSVYAIDGLQRRETGIEWSKE
jgi:hypothetical protein